MSQLFISFTGSKINKKMPIRAISQLSTSLAGLKKKKKKKMPIRAISQLSTCLAGSKNKKINKKMPIRAISQLSTCLAGSKNKKINKKMPIRASSQVSTSLAGGAIRCWDCNSKFDPRCGYDKFDNHTLEALDCSQTTPSHLEGMTASYCRKITQYSKCQQQGLLYHRTCKPDFMCSWPSLNSYLE